RKNIYVLLFLSILSLSQIQARTTILIHGTLFTFISYYIHGVSAPRGLTLLKEVSLSNSLSRMGHMLSQASLSEFPLDTFYLYGWSGHLNEKIRFDVARELYELLKERRFESLTIIGHSHGATIALLLAELAQQEQNTSFFIDQLILLACPVQKVTAHLV